MNEGRTFLTGEVTVSEFPTIPPGTYDATLDGVTEEVHELYGTRWVWHWAVLDAHPDGGDFELQVWTPPRLSNTGMAIEQAKALGVTAAKGARVDLGAFCGKQARLIVTLDEERGRNKVKAVMPAQAAEPAPSSTGDPEYAKWAAEREAQEAVTGAPTAEEPARSAAPGTEASGDAEG